MSGHIRKRGKASWELKFDVSDSATGRRKTRYASVKGSRRDAQRELVKLLAAADAGALVEPNRLTIAGYLTAWLNGPHGLAGKTAERYQQLAEQQIIPHLGALPIQKLKPAHIADWHSRSLTGGGKDGRPLSVRTVLAAHRVLHRLLARAVEVELLLRNVASVVKPPKVQETEIEILRADQIDAVLAALKGHALEPIAVLALGSGCRRGELLALGWKIVDFVAATIKIERSLEQTRAGLAFKSPKTKHGRRTVALPPIALDALRAHRRRQLELRMAVGLGRLEPDSLVFSTIDGNPIPPKPQPGMGPLREGSQAAGHLVSHLTA